MSTKIDRKSPGILVALALCMALQMTGFVMILPLFARRFESFGAGVEALGISAMAYALTSTVAAPFIGTLADRIGRRPIILLSLAAYIVAFSGYLFATSTWLLIVLRGLAGVFTAGLIPAITGSVGDLALEDRRAQWIGILNGGASVGWIAGPILGGLLYDHFGYVVPFAAAIVMTVGALLLAVFLIPETYKDTHLDRSRSSLKSGFQTLSSPSTFFLLMLISFGVMFAWAFIEPKLMFYAYDDLGWTSSQLGLAMSTYGAALMFGEFALGQLSDRVGRKPVLALGLMLFSAQFIGLAIFHNVTWIVMSFILAGLGNALYDPALSAYILDITPPEYKARSMGLKSTVGSIGSLLGPASVVLISPFAGPQVVFLISAGLVFVLTFISGLALHTPQLIVSSRFESQSTLTLQK
ncbi:MAG: MFS transporter [Chloroflexi bacterium]|nr:MFS transporter [Chloroflexota bacterium]